MTAPVSDGSAAWSSDHPGRTRSADAGLPTTTTPAQYRVVTDVLGWGEPRPVAPDGLTARLRDRLEDGLRALGDSLQHLAGARRGGRIVVSRSLLQRSVCQGWQLAPEPYVHTAANVRGVLGRRVILADLDDERQPDPVDVVARCWHRLASDRPGDPRSIASWMNRADPTERAALQMEAVELLTAVREVWPSLPPDRVQLATDVPRRVTLAGGVVVLASTVDLAVDSRIDDGRARRLVVDLRTGQPRAPLDRLALRFVALCSALAENDPPFRWTTFYVTEGRFVSEDLVGDGAMDPIGDPLGWVVERIIGAVAELVELDLVPVDAPESALRLAAGRWCTSCRRRHGCSVAATGTDARTVPPG